MKLKLSIIAAAMVVAGQASAAIQTGTGINDQLFLSVWDPVAQASYTRGLGINGSSLISGYGISFGTATNGSGFTATGGTSAQNYSLAADANLSSFLSTYAADAASMQWNVIAGDGAQTYGSKGLLVTSNSMVTGWSSSYFTTMGGFAGTYIPAVNALMPAGSVAGNTDSISTTLAVGGPAYAAATTAYFGDQLGNTAPFHTAANLGVSQNFYLLNTTTNARGQYVGAAGVYQFANTTGTASTWTLGSNGALTYSVAQSVAAVPEPGEWALMLSGFGLFGFIAKRRQARMA